MRWPWQESFWQGDGESWPSPGVLLIGVALAAAVALNCLQGCT
jgi:hypothetical protein